MWEGEIDDVERLLDDDVCNNSAWSYRYFLLHKSPTGTYNSLVAGSPEFVEAEMKYVLGERLPFKWDNEACWVYLRGMFCQTPEEEEASKTKSIKRSYIVRYKDFLGPYLDKAVFSAQTMPEETSVRWIFMLMIDLSLADESPAKAKLLMERLRDNHDKIRRNYWQWKIN